MCNVCRIKNSTTVGSVVMNVRRCSSRTAGDKGKHLADKEVLFYVTEVAARGEGVYCHVIKKEPGKLGKTRAHIRDCEYVNTTYNWDNGRLT